MSRWNAKIKEYGAKILMILLSYLPIKPNKVFMMSYYGKGYDCNPKYLTDYLVKHISKYPWDIVWAFNDINQHKQITGIRSVKTMSLRYFYELCTAKVIITNYRMPEYFHKRQKQYYIQTWHSSLRLKKIEGDAEDSLSLNYIKMAKKDSRQCDLLISGCKFSTEIFKRAFWYTGSILECGTPRNDYLVHPRQNEQVRIKERLGIEVHKKIILYAPTFRKDHNLEVYDLEYKSLQHWAEEKWGGKWCICIRLHPHLDSKKLHITWSEDLRDVSKWEDIQELLLIADIVISDYSSLIFDFSFTKRPCFLYTPDMQDYIAHDRGLYFNIQSLPFEIATDKEMLKQKIMAFDTTQYEERLQSFMQKIESFEEGTACQHLAEHIEHVINL